MIDPLDILLSEALHEASRKKIKPLPEKSDRLDKIRESFRSNYEKPENWIRTRGIALIHRDENGATTLLGNFSEFIHKKNKIARKLVREGGLLQIAAQEFVTGSWWLRTDTLERMQESVDHEERDTRMDIVLGELQVFSHDVKLRIFLVRGWIARVELVEQTQFVCPTNSQFIFLPKGLDILEGMDYDSKMVLRKKMGV